MSYNNFISKNIAPINATKIGIYNENNQKVGHLNLGNLKTPTNIGNKKYSFGLFSDPHIIDESDTDFKNALNYVCGTENVDFICITGDISSMGTNEQLQFYKTIVEKYATKPVYAVSGNHEGYNENGTNIGSFIQTYTDKPLYYSFEKNGDIFIFMGLNSKIKGQIFTDDEWQWLYETLEENRNKRCFLFEHLFVHDSSGNGGSKYNNFMMSTTEESLFKSLMAHYTNIIFFHGHSHLRYRVQEVDKTSNYSNALGCQDVHVPSIRTLRDIDENGKLVSKPACSEGYIVDVYSNHIILKGRDFITEKFLPIATYCLDTTLKNITEGTYTDSTGKINTSNSYNITNNLTNASTNNTTTTVSKHGTYNAILTANNGYELSNVTVKMNGIDITNEVYSSDIKTINITDVSGSIIITAIATLIEYPCTSITLDNSNLTFTDTNNKTLIATVQPSNTTDVIKWNSDDKNIATVNNGVVTPIKDGECNIIASCGNQSASCHISITLPQTFTITNNLTNATNTNALQRITENSSYNAVLKPDVGYSLDKVTVTMGGTDITSSSFAGSTIVINKVTGDIIITVTTKDFTPTYTFNWDNTSGSKLTTVENTPITQTLIPTTPQTSLGETSVGYFMKAFNIIELKKPNYALKAKINVHNYRFGLGICNSNDEFRGLSTYDAVTFANNSKGNDTYSVVKGDFNDKDHEVEIICNQGNYVIKIDGTMYTCDVWKATPKYGVLQNNVSYYKTVNGVGVPDSDAITPNVNYPFISIVSDTSYFYIKELSFAEWE